MSRFENIGSLQKEPTHDVPQSRANNAGVAVLTEVGHQ